MATTTQQRVLSIIFSMDGVYLTVSIFLFVTVDVLILNSRIWKKYVYKWMKRTKLQKESIKKYVKRIWVFGREERFKLHHFNTTFVPYLFSWLCSLLRISSFLFEYYSFSDWRRSSFWPTDRHLILRRYPRSDFPPLPVADNRVMRRKE